MFRRTRKLGGSSSSALVFSYPSVAVVRSEGLEVAEPDCYWQGVEYVESDMQADCWTQSEGRAGLEWEYRIWGAA